jgi:signal transduction histidine kinase
MSAAQPSPHHPAPVDPSPHHPAQAGENPALCGPEELRSLFLFEKLTDEQLAWLCREGRTEVFEPGPVYAEGDPATCFYVLLSGTVVMSRLVGGDDVEVGRTSSVGVYSGAFNAYLGDRVPQVYLQSVRVTEPSRFFVLDAAKFAQLMNEWFPMAVHLLEGLFFGQKNTQEAIGQRERLLALGSLSAGLTHELNNPASAAVRATASLRERVAGMRHKLAMIAAHPKDPATLIALMRLQEEAAARVAKAPVLTPLEASDREDIITDWLGEQGVANGWDLAATFTQAGLDTAWLDQVSATMADSSTDPLALDSSLRWISYTVETELLMNEIEDSVTRISTLVGATKQYSQLDRAPYQVVDVHDLLDSTLMMLGGKIGDDITVVKDYDLSLPRIPAYPGELNQVWTNLIDNAVSAMNGTGTLTVRTALDRDQVLIEFGDTGPGIPPDIQSRIFEPFFTTKSVGQGTGLGLDISFRIVANRHHGDLRVRSEPGDTRFQVWLPLTAQENGQAPTGSGTAAS